MNILYITAYDNQGQQFNGYLLHKALKKLGYNSHMAVAQSSLTEPGISELGGTLLKRINEILVSLERELLIQ